MQDPSLFLWLAPFSQAPLSNIISILKLKRSAESLRNYRDSENVPQMTNLEVKIRIIMQTFKKKNLFIQKSAL